MKADELKECGLYFLRRKRNRIPVRYLGFSIDRYLFENTGDRVDELGHDELNAIEEMP
jgi:hypothetical protein